MASASIEDRLPDLRRHDVCGVTCLKGTGAAAWQLSCEARSVLHGYLWDADPICDASMEMEFSDRIVVHAILTNQHHFHLQGAFIDFCYKNISWARSALSSLSP